MSPVYAALLHYPVKDREGKTVTTAVTNLDVHDIARSARAYGLAGYFIVTPIAAQRTLVEQILEHWRSGGGAKRIPERSEALSRVRVVGSVEDVREAVRALHGIPPRVLVTGAKPLSGAPLRTHAEERSTLRSTRVPTLIVFGTGHGLAAEVVANSDGVLAPIQPTSDYNHLSVRAAAAIYFDRLLGEPV